MNTSESISRIKQACRGSWFVTGVICSEASDGLALEVVVDCNREVIDGSRDLGDLMRKVKVFVPKGYALRFAASWVL